MIIGKTTAGANLQINLDRLVESRPRQGIGRHEKRPLPERFWEKVQKSDGCWIWTASTNGKPGYGIFRGGVTRDKYGSRTWVLAHRFAHQLVIGPIPVGAELDHLCRTRLCVNPKHLEPITHRENTLRGTAPPAIRARQTNCKSGHPFSAENTSIDSGKRRCRECRRQYDMKRYYLDLKGPKREHRQIPLEFVR